MTTKKKYYAVRIGRPGRHATYFMTRHDGTGIADLFLTRHLAESARPHGVGKVVRVTLHDGRCA